MLCVVNKPFVYIEGEPPLRRGTEIDSSALRNSRGLLASRYLVPQKDKVSWCRVVRKFAGHKAGEEVNVTNWRNAEYMIEQRYLEPIQRPTKKKGAKHATRNN